MCTHVRSCSTQHRRPPTREPITARRFLAPRERAHTANFSPLPQADGHRRVAPFAWTGV